jgi:hypothetical protein
VNQGFKGFKRIFETRNLKLETSTKCSEAKVSDIPKVSDISVVRTQKLKNLKTQKL